jgi:hypothetical protein
MVPGASIERVFLVPSFSRMRSDIAWLENALGLYRVVLGQPGQERLLQKLQARIEAAQGAEKDELLAWYRSEALCLSPFLRSTRTGSRAAPNVSPRSHKQAVVVDHDPVRGGSRASTMSP